MKLLFDTNVLLWATREPSRLSKNAARAILDPHNDRFVSLVSMWELQIKFGPGKLTLPSPIEDLWPLWMRDLAATTLPIEARHIGGLSRLPQIHKDPFDRLLAAQARHEGMTIVSSDQIFSQYGIPMIS